jgi:peptide chain release factor 1
MLDKLQEIEYKYIDIERKMSDPEIISDHAAYQELIKKHNELQDGVVLFRRFKKLEAELTQAKELLKDPEMKDMAQEEINTLEDELKTVQADLQILLIPADPNDHRNAIIEIRSGTGGEEAALFAFELFRMYTRYAEARGWKVDVLSGNPTGIGGVKEVTFGVEGKGVFSRLKFESGTHRVQRVPETETSGRVHTSAATVAIMPEAEEVDVVIDPKDIKMDVFRASGAGGQHVNKTSSAVRLTHLPSGIAVACQDERSQFQNRDRAMKMLRAKLYEIKEEERRKQESDLRKNQVGSGDRSEKIRTYNFPQNRVTDHRIGVSLYSLTDFMEGHCDELFDALISADRLSKMQNE